MNPLGWKYAADLVPGDMIARPGMGAPSMWAPVKVVQVDPASADAANGNVMIHWESPDFAEALRYPAKPDAVAIVFLPPAPAVERRQPRRGGTS